MYVSHVVSVENDTALIIRGLTQDTNALAPARAQKSIKEAVASNWRAPRQSADLAGARIPGTGHQLVKDLRTCFTFEASLCLFDRIECSACCAKRITGLSTHDLCDVLPSVLSERISSIPGAWEDSDSIRVLCQKISHHHRLMRGSHWPDRWKHVEPNGRSSQFEEIQAKSIEMAVDWDK